MFVARKLHRQGGVEQLRIGPAIHIPCECDHRADELIGLKVDVSGEFITDFESFSFKKH